MKKIIIVAAVLMVAAPVFAAVNITCEQVDDTNEVVVSFDNTDPNNKIRAISIDICLSDGNIVDVNCVNTGYDTYPGSIDISEDGEIEDEGTCVCSPSYPGTLGDDANCVTIEMGSLHIGDDNAPPQSGELLSFRIEGVDTGTVTVDINDNIIRGGVVMEDPNETPATNLPDDCDVLFEEPNQCWDDVNDCNGQPMGDGTCNGSVNFADLAQLKTSFFKNKGDPDYNCCADYDQNESVNFGDLAILKTNFFSGGYTPATGAQGCPP